MKIAITSIYVDDQEKALEFYTNKLGFRLSLNIPLGENHRWLTVVAPDAPDVELLLEIPSHPASRPYKEALFNDGIPFTMFGVENIASEYNRLVEAGVEFTKPPTRMGNSMAAVLNDTCGNLIQIIQFKA